MLTRIFGKQLINMSRREEENHLPRGNRKKSAKYEEYDESKMRRWSEEKMWRGCQRSRNSVSGIFALMNQDLRELFELIIASLPASPSVVVIYVNDFRKISETLVKHALIIVLFSFYFIQLFSGVPRHLSIRYFLPFFPTLSSISNSWTFSSSY